jgi:hypothetical protein
MIFVGAREVSVRVPKRAKKLRYHFIATNFVRKSWYGEGDFSVCVAVMMAFKKS